MSAIVTYEPLGGVKTGSSGISGASGFSGIYTLDPPPFVSQSRQEINAGLMRLGHEKIYELDGLYSGSNDSFADFEALSNIFSQSPAY